MSDNTVIIYYGDIIDGISVDGETFGAVATTSHTITLAANEQISALEFGHHTHR